MELVCIFGMIIECILGFEKITNKMVSESTLIQKKTVLNMVFGKMGKRKNG